jgi:acyl-CoA dehydrogenase
MRGRPAPATRKIQETLANLKRKMDVARLLALKAAWMADLRIPNTKEASMAKAYAGQMVQEVTSRCLELMGIYGVIVDNYVEKCFRDQKVFDIFEGTGQIQRIVISRRIFEKLSSLQLT